MSREAASLLPSTLAGAADHISESLDIAMFSITRRLRNQTKEGPSNDLSGSMHGLNDTAASFLSRESDNDLRNLTVIPNLLTTMYVTIE